MHYILLGFSQDENVRRFRFQAIIPDRSRVEFTVDADLVTVRRYRIEMQELPLLCRRMLEERPEGDFSRSLTFTEAGMRVYADARAIALKAAVRKPGFQPGTGGRILGSSPAAE